MLKAVEAAWDVPLFNDTLYARDIVPNVLGDADVGLHDALHGAIWGVYGLWRTEQSVTWGKQTLDLLLLCIKIILLSFNTLNISRSSQAFLVHPQAGRPPQIPVV